MKKLKYLKVFLLILLALGCLGMFGSGVDITLSGLNELPKDIPLAQKEILIGLWAAAAGIVGFIVALRLAHYEWGRS